MFGGVTDQEITVRYFAGARELAGTSEEHLGLGTIGTHAELRAALGARHPALAPLLGCMRLAVNDAFVDASYQPRAGDVVDVLPPVAGGSLPLAEIRTTPLSMDEVYAAVAHPSAGGVTLFVGVVRDTADGRPVARLDYEHHPALAIAELRAVLREVMDELASEGVRLAATHRIGELAVGDLAVVVGASAPHRDAAFRGCRLAIDRIKERVPIWKKEWEPGGAAHWVNLDDHG
jgi:molybdopterin synthase catalytic subunit/molybdopterin converting factor small subunit